jgi:hypothetical protein
LLKSNRTKHNKTNTRISFRAFLSFTRLTHN